MGGAELQLLRNHLIGRAASCDLKLPYDCVSLQHARLRWTDLGWELEDLGSLDGSYVNGVRVGTARLAQGDRIYFGREVQVWEFTDAEAPQVLAVSEHGGPPVSVDAGILAIPDPEDPRVSIYRNSQGGWTLEHADDLVPLADQQRFSLDGAHWVFHNPKAFLATSSDDERASRRMLDAALRFKVSRDEARVELSVMLSGRSVDLGHRAHHRLLLLLARQKLHDATRGFPPSVCGWVHQDELTQGLQAPLAQLNLDIFRIRTQFGRLGIADAGEIVQRRPRTKQLRIGAQNLTETLV